MTRPEDLDAAGDLLRRHGVNVDTRALVAAKQHLAGQAPVNRCVRCGATDEDNELAGYGPLTDVTVVFADGQEGHAEQRRLLCNDHAVELAQLLVDRGFGSHRHGGINWLEDTHCPGASEPAGCPHPEPEL